MGFEAITPNIDRRKKVLITGHTGFKGTWLTVLLESLGFEVQGLALEPEINSLYNSLKRRGKIQEEFVDLRDQEKLANTIRTFNPSYVFHLAAQPLVLESYRQPVETFATNVMGTANLLDSLFSTKSVEGIIVSTTDKVYKNLNSGERFTENHPLEGKDPYSASKVGTESVIKAWQQIEKISGGPYICAVRAGNVIGGGDFAQDRLIPDLIRSVTENKTLTIRNPKSTRPWQHALDPLTGYVLSLNAMLSGNRSTAYNFGPQEASLPVEQVLAVAEKIIGPINKEVQSSSEVLESALLDLNSEKAMKELNWKPAWTQHEAISATMKWWESYLKAPSEAVSITMRDIDFRLNHR
jgi:CDP-glucose 4,6-dehydratase